MSEQETTRRDFLKATSAVVAGSALAGQVAAGATTKPADTSKILNYNPKMGYRPLGRTGIMISEISLGGHGGTTVEDRIPVLEKAAELGMNYVDNNIAEECAMYGKALRGKRDRWHIGFGSWPEKLTPDYEKELTKEGMAREIENRLKDYHTDMLDMWRPVGATWGEGQTRRETLWDVSPRVLDMVVEVFEKARKQGKVRWLGISAHNPKVFRRVLNEYPQFSVIIFPYLFLTREIDSDGLLTLAEKQGVGVIGLKPFGAGVTFGLKPAMIHGDVDSRAHVLIREMLRERRISAIIPGVNTPDQLMENVKGSYERDRQADADDKEALRGCRENYHAHLTPEYAWLHHWETV